MCWLCYDSAVKPSSHRSKVFIFPSRVTVEVVSEVNCDQELELTPEASSFTLAEGLKYFRESHLGHRLMSI